MRRSRRPAAAREDSLQAEAARQFRESLSLSGEVGFLEGAWEVLVSLAEVERGDALKAARLLGAATRIGREAGFISPQSAAADRVAQAAREQLGVDAFDAASEEGAAMTLAEIVEYVSS